MDQLQAGVVRCRRRHGWWGRITEKGSVAGLGESCYGPAVERRRKQGWWGRIAEKGSVGGVREGCHGPALERRRR